MAKTQLEKTRWIRNYRKQFPERARAASRKSGIKRRIEKPAEVHAYHNKYMVVWRLKNIEKARRWNLEQKAKAFARDPEGVRSKRRIRNSKWKRNNKPKVAASAAKQRLNNPESCRRAKEKYNRNNVELIRLRARLAAHNRRVKCTTSPEELGRIKRFVQAEKSKRIHVCYYCTKRFYGTFDIEHIHPLAKGGKHCMSNLCVSCDQCNSRKFTKKIGEWQPNNNQPLLSI